MFNSYMNRNSRELVENIYNGIKFHPSYSGYDINTNYDQYHGIITLDISLNEMLINKFMFCGSPNGKLSSIAIYGTDLLGHMNAIRSSMKIFGLDVTNVEYDNQGLNPFIDVALL